jgi:hypothetical protein
MENHLTPFFSNNLKVTLIFKSLFLFSIGVYVLTLPLLTIKFGIVDGVNFMGYISPNWVLFGECVFCIILSLSSISWSLLTVKKLMEIFKNENKKTI